MSTLRIDRVALSGRLPGRDVDARARAEGLVRRACDAVLARAFDEAGLGGEGEVCIRALDVPLHVPRAMRDDDIAELWSRSVAESVRRALHAGGPGVIVYGSRAHALGDVLLAASRGDLARAWAWRQLGLWSRTELTAGLERALLAHPELTVAALRATALAGALLPLLRALPGQTWTRVAAAALAASGASDVVVRAVLEARAEPAAPVASARALRIMAASALWGAVARGTRTWLAPATRRAFAALAVAEVEPLTLHAPQAVALVAELASQLGGRARAAETEPEPDHSLSHSPSHSPGHSRFVGGSGGAKPPSPLKPADRVGKTHRDPEPNQAEGLVPLSELLPGFPDLSATATASEAPDDLTPLTPLTSRSRASTRFGGLLYLLNLVGPLGLPESLFNDAALQARSPREALQLLALTLLRGVAGFEDAADDDPAARAFAGLPPAPADTRPGLPKPTPEEHAALLSAAWRLTEALAQELGAVPEDRAAQQHVGAAEATGRARGAHLAMVVSRPAEIVADPGWIEVHFSLEDVDTNLRRSGLDLDPGYLPWLGTIVKFRYV